MILILNIIDHNRAAWMIVKFGSIRYSYDFIMRKGEENVLLYLDEFLKNNKLKFKDIKALILIVKEASLTQVKIFTAVINTIGWQFDLPVIAEYYFKGQANDILSILLKKVVKRRKFKPLSVKYKQEPNITISTKKKKFRIIK